MVTADTRRLHLLGELRHSAKSSMLAISSSKNTGVILVEIRSGVGPAGKGLLGEAFDALIYLAVEAGTVFLSSMMASEPNSYFPVAKKVPAQFRQFHTLGPF